jgi:dipeptidyl-peptidase-4
VQWKGDLCVLPDIENLKVVSPNNGKEVVIATKTEVNQLLESMQLGKIQHFYNIEFPYSDNKDLVPICWLQPPAIVFSRHK